MHWLARRAGPPAYTLVEVLIAVAIVLTMAALLMPALSHAVLHARLTQVRHDLCQVRTALWHYGLDHEAFPPTRTYCLTAKRHLDCALPPELWELGYLDHPVEDVFNPGQTYRYTALGPVSFNDSPPSGVHRYSVPAHFPQPGGAIRSFGPNDETAPLRAVLWSAGPGGPPVEVCYSLDGVRPENPAHWYPAKPNGILCHYFDGKDWRFSY